MSIESERVLAAFLERRQARAGGPGQLDYHGHPLGEYRDRTDGENLYFHGNRIASHAEIETLGMDDQEFVSSPFPSPHDERMATGLYRLLATHLPLPPYEPLSDNIIITLASYNTLTTRERLNDLITAFLPTPHPRHDPDRYGGPAQIYTERGDPYVSQRQIDDEAWYFLKARQKDVFNPQREFDSIRDDMRAGLISIMPDPNRRYHGGLVYDSPKSPHRRRGELALEKIRKYYRSMYAEEMNEGPTGGDMFIYLHAPHYLFPSVVIDTRPRVRRLTLISRQLNSYDLLSHILRMQITPGMR